MNVRLTISVFSILFVLGVFPDMARTQSTAAEGDASAEAATMAPKQPSPNYTRPTHRAMVDNYLFDAFGLYAMGGAVVAAGFNQWSNSPPEWKRGAEGFGKRFGSDFAMAAVGTTTRYALSEVLSEDARYFRCDCRGVLPRLNHAVISTVTARHGQDGHRLFSFSALMAPYVSSTTAVYGWYPDRYGEKDAFRMGNYTLLTYIGGNIAREFLSDLPHLLLSRMHKNRNHSLPDSGPDR